MEMSSANRHTDFCSRFVCLDGPDYAQLSVSLLHWATHPTRTPWIQMRLLRPDFSSRCHLAELSNASRLPGAVSFSLAHHLAHWQKANQSRHRAFTAVKVHRHYPALKWFFVAIALCHAATSALLVLALTFLKEVVEFSSSHNATAIIILLVASIPACLLSSWWNHRLNPVHSFMMAVTILIINTALVAGILEGPDQELAAYLFAIGWGIGIGWKWTCDRMLFAAILPPGQNAEFSGAFVFFQCLTW